jgi:hypothetical protein
MRKLILILSILFLYSCDDLIMGVDCIECTDPSEFINGNEDNPECEEQELETCPDWTCVEDLDDCTPPSEE